MLNINPTFFKPNNHAKPKETELSVFYTNDMHGDLTRLDKFKTAHDEFKKQNEKTMNLTLAAGDCLFGSDKARSGLLVKLFNFMKLDALALGNHEFAAGSDELAEKLQNAEFKSVSANLEIPENSKLSERVKDKKLVKSAVFMKGGEKFAVIGASPINSYIGIRDAEDKKTKPLNIDKTIKAINDEAKMLEKQGINKIILCSHLGYSEEGDLKVARETEGIDVIVGGHSHTAINGVNTQTSVGDKKLNLLKSKRNEPVIITQTSGMNRNVGFLNLVFDEDGIIKTPSIKNEVISLDNFSPDNKVKFMIENSLGKNITLAKVKTPYEPKNPKEERNKENPLANIFADALVEAGKSQGVQASIFNAATIRGGMKDEIKSYDVKYSMLPFNTNINSVNMKESDIVKLLNENAKFYANKGHEAAVLRCGGLKYDMLSTPEKNAKGEDIYIKNMAFVDENGNNVLVVDTLNPSETNQVNMAICDYLFNYKVTKDVLKPYKEQKVCFGQEQQIFTDYLLNKKEVDYDKAAPNRINIL